MKKSSEKANKKIIPAKFDTFSDSVKKISKNCTSEPTNAVGSNARLVKNRFFSEKMATMPKWTTVGSAVKRSYTSISHVHKRRYELNYFDRSHSCEKNRKNRFIKRKSN